MHRTLVTIEREKISTNLIYGFILKESDNLLMIQETVDLKPDGILVINKKDITDIYSNKSNHYQTQMLKEFGIYQSINFNVDYNVKNWKKFFESASKDFAYYCIDDNSFGIYMEYIGKLKKINKHSIKLHEFSGVGKWYKKPTKIYYDGISLCAVGGHYVETYADYFALKDRLKT